MSKVVNLTYTGEIKAILGDGNAIVFVTQHEQGMPTAVYKLNAETNKLVEVELPCGGISILKIGERYWVGGDEGSLFSLGENDRSVKAYKVKLPGPVSAMAALSEDRIALLVGEEVWIVNEKAKSLQALKLEDVGTAIASNPGGDWLAVGTNKGRVLVFQSEDQDEFVLSESEVLHEGGVTSLLFEPESLRFFSAGTDRKLLLTHARGHLEPEDRGRTNIHADSIVDMRLAGEGRVITGSRDKSCKSWARAGKTKPSTLSEGLVAVSRLSSVIVHKRENLVVACEDHSIRLFLLDAEGRIGNSLTRYNDIYVRAKGLFASRESSDRGLAMQELAALDDRRGAEMLAERVEADSDNKLRLTAAKLLVKTSHSQLPKILLAKLKHPDSPVRMLMLESLEKQDSENLVDLYQAAIKTEHGDIGSLAIQSLAKLANTKGFSEANKNRALAVLSKALNSGETEIRNAAIFGLETLFDKNSTRPSLMTLDSTQSDSKRKGLIRLMQRGLLSEPTASAGLRRAVEDKFPEVRQAAFLISVLARPNLSQALRNRDKDLDRKLKELETFDFDVVGKGSKGKKTSKRRTTRKKVISKRERG